MMTGSKNNKHYLIIGLGLTGLSCARFCQSKGLTFSLCDTRSELAGIDAIKEEFPGISISLGLLTAEFLSEFDELLVSPGISVNTPVFQAAKERGVVISGDVQLFSEYRTKPLIAISGSNGKSTVTTLVASLLNEAGVRATACGNIGLPVLDLLSEEDDSQVYVAELSSFQLETTRNLNADVAGILNISPDHMDRYAGMADYERAKQRIFQGAKHVVINGNDDHTIPVLSGANKSSHFSLDTPAAADFGLIRESGRVMLCKGSDPLIDASALKIRGMHNVANALAALAFVDALDVEGIDIDLSDCLPALTSFTGLDHRCQHVATAAGVDYINDSKGTNEGSTVAAIEGLAPLTQGSLWLIAGGESKGQTFTELAAACTNRVAGAYVFGADKAILAAALSGHTKVLQYNTLSEALNDAALAANADDVVLFSPACASFDQFKNYVQRGEYFVQCVEGLS
ncbi:MAG: UDP-N-acetylmuramoyl-L-alanine--D-glutamate ligase [Thalassolituus sp.]|nr:MAG: UDP-N-acetylmuramoyl-L-alanine--D-glutamate ligase [Thalassolituus sp.]